MDSFTTPVITQATADQLVQAYLARFPELGPVEEEGQHRLGHVYFLATGEAVVVGADGSVTQVDPVEVFDQ